MTLRGQPGRRPVPLGPGTSPPSSKPALVDSSVMVCILNSLTHISYSLYYSCFLYYRTHHPAFQICMYVFFISYVAKTCMSLGTAPWKLTCIFAGQYDLFMHGYEAGFGIHRKWGQDGSISPWGCLPGGTSQPQNGMPRTLQGSGRPEGGWRSHGTHPPCLDAFYGHSFSENNRES